MHNITCAAETAQDFSRTQALRAGWLTAKLSFVSMWVIAACRVCSDPSLHTVGDAIRHIEAIGLAEIGATLRLISTLSLALGAIVMSASLIIPSIASFLSWTLKSVLFKDKRV